MIFLLFRRNARPDTISTLYGTIVAQARLPCFYRDYAVADTVNGCFDLIVLLALVLDRLAQDPAVQSLGQGIFDRFCEDMDHNLREMGVGDLKVPKQMRQFAGGNFATEYCGWPPTLAAAPRLAAHVGEALRDLRAQPSASLAGGELHLPEPSKIAPVTS